MKDASSAEGALPEGWLRFENGRLESLSVALAHCFGETPAQLLGSPIEAFFPHYAQLDAQPGTWLVTDFFFPARAPLRVRVRQEPTVGQAASIRMLQVAPPDILQAFPATSTMYRRELEAIYRALSDLFFLFHADGRILKVQANAPDLLLKPVNELLGKNIREVLPPASYKIYRESIAKVLRYGEPLTMEYALQLKKRPEKTVFEARLARVSNEQVVAAIRDITPWKATEERVQASEQLYKQLIETQTDFIVRTDPRGILDYVNTALCRYVNRPPEKLLGRHASELIPSQDDRDRLLKLVAELTPEVAVVPYVFSFLDSENTRRWQEWRVNGVFSPSTGKMKAIQGVGRDITRQKQVQNELRKSRDEARAATRSKSTFIATLSHEIRTPLNGIIGAASLLESTGLNDEQEEYAQTIRSSSEALLSLMNDILEFSRIEHQKLELKPRPFQLEKLCHQCFELFRPMIRERNLRISCNVAKHTPRVVVADGDRLRQVLVNLIGNAVKFTEEGSIRLRVQPATRQPSGKVQLHFSLEDTGIGIPPDRMKELFEPFTQVDAARNRKYQGTGLGLSIVRGILERMGGQISVESNPGQGSLFSFWVEAELPEPGNDIPDPYPADKKVNLQAELPPLRILIAEDNPVNYKLMDRILQKLGFSPVAVPSGHEVLEITEHRDFDLILMDVQMPGLDGMQTTRRLRSRKGHQPYVLAITAGASEEDFEACLAAGMNDYLAKPVRIADLEAALQRCAQALQRRETGSSSA